MDGSSMQNKRSTDHEVISTKRLLESSVELVHHCIFLIIVSMHHFLYWFDSWIRQSFVNLK